MITFIAIAAVGVTVASFFVYHALPDRSKDISKLDKASLVYNRGREFVKAGELDKAVSAFIMAVNRFPSSEYTEKSLRRLAEVYREKGDQVKEAYYYRRLLKSFPKIEDRDAVKADIEKLDMDILFSPAITEDSIEYEVRPGESLYIIANKFNTTVPLIKKINRLESNTIRVGQKLKINVATFSILVDKSENTLVLKKDGELFKTYKISTGKDNCTPIGKFKIEEKEVKPPWYRPDGKLVQPDSPEYELGERWMGLSLAGYGIHGTNDESTIGGQVTMGCVRMHNRDVIELFDIVPSGTEVEIVE